MKYIMRCLLVAIYAVEVKPTNIVGTGLDVKLKEEILL